MNYKNIEFHNDQSDALDAKIKEAHHKRSNLYRQSKPL